MKKQPTSPLNFTPISSLVWWQQSMTNYRHEIDQCYRSAESGPCAASSTLNPEFYTLQVPCMGPVIGLLNQINRPCFISSISGPCSTGSITPHPASVYIKRYLGTSASVVSASTKHLVFSITPSLDAMLMNVRSSPKHIF